jgi:hypothetical protein
MRKAILLSLALSSLAPLAAYAGHYSIEEQNYMATHNGKEIGYLGRDGKRHPNHGHGYDSNGNYHSWKNGW